MKKEIKRQNYENHIHYYPPHHFFFYGFAMTLLGLCTYAIIKSQEHTFLWAAATSIVFMVIWLSFMLRQHYALGNQNRIARIELRFRYYALTQKHFEEKEQYLLLSQILALRFAPNEELVALTDRAIAENLSADEIKKSVKNWLPDYMRL